MFLVRSDLTVDHVTISLDNIPHGASRYTCNFANRKKYFEERAMVFINQFNHEFYQKTTDLDHERKSIFL